MNGLQSGEGMDRNGWKKNPKKGQKGDDEDERRSLK